MNNTKLIAVDLNKEEKAVILKYADFVINNEATTADLSNGRKKWIRFEQYELNSAIDELVYRFNRCKSDYEFYLLDQLIGHMEHYK